MFVASLQFILIVFMVIFAYSAMEFCWERPVAREQIEIRREVDCSWRPATRALSSPRYGPVEGLRNGPYRVLQ